MSIVSCAEPGVMRQWLAYDSKIPEKELARVLTEVIHGALSGSMQERKAGK